MSVLSGKRSDVFNRVLGVKLQTDDTVFFMRVSLVTKGGYWLVKVVEKEDDRPISDEDRYFLKNKALGDWITSLSNDPGNKVESYLDSDKKAWAVGKVLDS